MRVNARNATTRDVTKKANSGDRDLIEIESSVDGEEIFQITEGGS